MSNPKLAEAVANMLPAHRAFMKACASVSTAELTSDCPTSRGIIQLGAQLEGLIIAEAARVDGVTIMRSADFKVDHHMIQTLYKRLQPTIDAIHAALEFDAAAEQAGGAK